MAMSRPMRLDILEEGNETGTGQYLTQYCPPELLQDMLYACAGDDSQSQENGDVNNNHEETHVDFYSVKRGSQELCQQVFNSCLKLVPDSSALFVKYAALELFERFMTIHVKEVKKQLKEEQHSPDVRFATQNNLKKQAILRLVSCIIIVFKYYDSNGLTIQTITNNCHKFIREVFPSINRNILIKSEARILRTVGFQVVKAMPLPVFQVLASVLTYNLPDIKITYYTSVYLVTNIYYLNRCDIHFMCRSCPSSRDFLLLLSVSILSVASFLTLHPFMGKMIDEELSYMTNLPSERILDLRDALLLMIIKGRQQQ